MNPLLIDTSPQPELLPTGKRQPCYWGWVWTPEDPEPVFFSTTKFPAPMEGHA